MKKLAAFLVLSLLLLTHLHGQDKMQEGYYINKEGNRVNGFFQLETPTSYCREILFAATKKGTITKQLPDDVKEYHLTAAHRKFKQHKLSKYAENGIIEVYVFIEVLVETSTHALYFYQGGAKEKRFFIKTPEMDFLELENPSQTKMVEGVSHKYTNKKYIGLLRVAFQACSDLKSLNLDALKLRVVPIAQAFLKGVECMGLSPTFISSTCSNRGMTQLSLGTGGSYSITNIARFPGVLGVPASTTVLSKGLFGVPVKLALLYFPAHIKKTLFIGFGTFYQLKGSYFEAYEQIFEQHYVGTNIYSGYQYPYGKVKPYIGGGLSIGFLANPQNAFRSTISNDAFQLGGTEKYIGQATELGYELFLGTDFSMGDHGVRIEFKYHHGYIAFYRRARYEQHAFQLLLKYRLTLSKRPKKIQGS